MFFVGWVVQRSKQEFQAEAKHEYTHTSNPCVCVFVERMMERKEERKRERERKRKRKRTGRERKKVRKTKGKKKGQTEGKFPGNSKSPDFFWGEKLTHWGIERKTYILLPIPF